MQRVVEAAPRDRQIALLRAHPDLAARAARARTLTDASRAEQRAAGLDELTEAEAAELQALNAAYRERFGFPFIICARKHRAPEIIAALRRRLANDPAAEVAAALREVGEIAGLRLTDLVEE